MTSSTETAPAVGPALRRVLDHVAEHPGGVGASDVAEALGLDTVQARTYLRRLVDAVRLDRPETGRYVPRSETDRPSAPQGPEEENAMTQAEAVGAPETAAAGGDDLDAQLRAAEAQAARLRAVQEAQRQRRQDEREARARALARGELQGFDPARMQQAAAARETAFRAAVATGGDTVAAYLAYRIGRLLDAERAGRVRAAADSLGLDRPAGHDLFSVFYDDLEDYTSMVDRVLRDEASASLDRARAASTARRVAYIETGESQ